MSPEMMTMLVEGSTNAALGILTLVVGNWFSHWVAGMAGRFCTARKLEVSLTQFLSQMIRYVVLAAVVIAALQRMGIETTSLLALLGSAGLAVGLALQGSLTNFASGVMILFFRPFKVGDVISAGGETGGVVEIGLFAVTMHTPDNRKIIVGNSGIMGGNIVNYTALDNRRSTVEVGVGYGSDIGEIMTILEGAANRSDKVLSDPGVGVAFIDMGASSLNFAVHFWTTTQGTDWLEGMHNVRRAIYEDLNAAGVDIPYDQIVVHGIGPEAAAAK